MEILFTKTGKEDHVFSCKREDGSVTWKQGSSFFILHDLCHFAVETVMQLKNAFYGMVEAGTDISDFDLPKEQRDFQITNEAIFAEHLVNLLVIEYTQGKMENLIEIFNGVYEEHRGQNESPVITDKRLEQIRILYHDLMH